MVPALLMLVVVIRIPLPLTDPSLSMITLPVPVIPPEIVSTPLVPLLVSVNPEEPTVIAPLTFVADPLLALVKLDLISVTLDPTAPVMLSVEL